MQADHERLGREAAMESARSSSRRSRYKRSSGTSMQLFISTKPSSGFVVVACKRVLSVVKDRWGEQDYALGPSAQPTTERRHWSIHACRLFTCRSCGGLREFDLHHNDVGNGSQGRA